jgi:nitrogen-specific signal transduction histidine kinase/CheY-like chemotaxis protein
MKDGDAPCFFVTLIQDITERKELERRFIEAQKMEVAGRLAAGIAHDFNNLLTVINGYSTLLLDKTAPEDTAHRELSQIRDAGERAATLTQRLLSFSRHEVVRPVILDLNIVISGMVHILRRLLGSSVALVTELEPVACPMEADQTEIEQVIMNLVINARDAMPAGGAVKITTRLASVKQEDAALLGLTAGKYVTLSVKDDGCGMDQGTMARIFEPFFTTKEVGKGTGLGLWMVRETAHQSRGSVAVESGLGKGTTFRMFFPRVQAPVSRASEPLVPSKVAPESKTVMVADDDAAIRMYVVDVLQAAGYIVLEAHNGRQAIETMSKRSIDLLITDLVMPDQDGLETINTTKIRFPNVKMIAMSGAFDGACLKAAFHMGADAKLHKPFGAATLREMVGRILGVPILKIASTTSPQ